jgi:cytochrome c2
MRSLSSFLAAAMFVALGLQRPALAIPQFYNVYKAEYLDNHPDKKYAEAVNKASDKCFVCHQGKKSKKNHNVFGEHLVGVLDRKKDSRDTEKIAAAIKKVVEMHVDPKDDKSETYLDRIKASKWPGGELDELKKEPPMSDTAK